MTLVAALCLILAVAGIVAYPLMSVGSVETAADASDRREHFEREKNIALLAMREADLDHAMGKLSEDDHSVLRGEYQQRAIGALAALRELPDEAISAPTNGDALREKVHGDRFCPSCGRRYEAGENFCAACGRRRTAP